MLANCDYCVSDLYGLRSVFCGGRCSIGVFCGWSSLSIFFTPESVHWDVGACDLYKLDKPSKVVTWFVGGSFLQYGIEIGCFCLNDNEVIQADAGVGACVVIISLIDIEIRCRI